MRLFFVIAALAAAALADTSAPPAGNSPYVMATLERTACYGSCPIYTLTIFSDGRVEWNGARFVKQRGKATATLSASELAQLREAFDAVGYFALGDGYDCYEMTDAPSANTSYSDGKQKKSIAHYHGCQSKPKTKELGELESKIDRIVKSERWVGTAAEREELRKKGKL
jgi:hypothetical protein